MTSDDDKGQEYGAHSAWLAFFALMRNSVNTERAAYIPIDLFYFLLLP